MQLDTKKFRQAQIKTVFGFTGKLVSEGMSVIASGDFNLSLKNFNIRSGRVQYYSERSFPSPKFYAKLKSRGLFHTFIGIGLRLKNGLTRSDHILYSLGVECKNQVPFETCSDSITLYAELITGRSISANREKAIT